MYGNALQHSGKQIQEQILHKSSKNGKAGSNMKKQAVDKLMEKAAKSRRHPFRTFLSVLVAFTTAYSLISPAVALDEEEAEDMGLLPEETAEVTEEVPYEEPVPVYEEVPEVYEEPAPMYEEEPAEVYEEPAPVEEETAEPVSEEPAPAEDTVTEEAPAAEAPAEEQPVVEAQPAAAEQPAEEEPASVVPSKTDYVYVQEGVLKATAVFTDPSVIPDEAELVVTEVDESTAGYNYEAYLASLNLIGDNKEYTSENTSLYDVAFVLDGKELPVSNTAVTVTFEFYASQLTDTNHFAVWHLPLTDSVRNAYPTTKDAVNINAYDVAVEPVTVTALTAGYVQFVSDSFSVYAFTTAEEKAAEPVVEEQTEEPAAAETVEEESREPLTFKDSVNGLDIKVTAEYDAFPEEVTMSVKMISASEVEESVSEAVDGKVRKVEAVDITFKNADGDDVQPIKPIQVVITPSEAPKQAEDVAVVHIDDAGEATVVEGVDTTDEAVVFEAESFSTYVVVYTVDFEYTVDGKVFTYSMAGGMTMSLKALIIALGIETAEDADLFINEVADVTFSNPELVRITKNSKVLFFGDNDWTIESLQPFHTHEELTVTMKDGQQFVIQSTDVQESADLRNFLTNVVISGAAQNADGQYEVEQGKEYSFTATFAESSSYQFDNDATLTYQMPDGITVLSRQNGPLKINIVYKGKTYQVDATYDLDTDGNLKINFDQSDPDYHRLVESTNVSFRFSYRAEFDGTATEIKFNDEVERDIIFEEPEPGQAFANKTASYDENTGKFTYTIKVNATGDVTSVNVKDVISGDALIFNNDVRVSGNSSGYTDNHASNGFDYTFASMREGEEITITYSANVDFSKDTDKDGKITVDQTKNTVTVKPDGGNPHNSEYSHEINFKTTSKSNGTEAGVTEDGDKIYNWEINYNPLALVSAAGDTITDKIGASSQQYMKYYGDGITVEVRDQSGNLVTTRNVRYSDLTAYSDSTWTYTIPSGDTTPYQYTIKYQTVVDMKKVAQGGVTVHVDNTANDQDGGADVTPKSKIGVTKDVESFNTEEVTWVSNLFIPEGGLVEAVVTDKLPYIWLNGRNVYDLYKDGSLEITGLLTGESYTVDLSEVGKVKITFYKDAGKQQTGLQGTEGGHTITVKLTTKVDQEWLQKGYETGSYEQNHTNTIDLNGVNDTATVTFGKPGIEKTGANLGGGSFKYTVVLSGVSDVPVSVKDTFDTSILEVDTSKSSEWDHMRIWGGNQYSQDAGRMPISYTETEDGVVLSANALPMQPDGNYYPYYKMIYYLKVKEGVDLEALAVANGGEYDVINTALWGDHQSEFTYKVEYDYPDKKLLNEGALGGTERTAKYQITFNPSKGLLNEGEPMTMVDVLSPNLSIDYGSIQITTDPVGQDVSYSLKGNDDGETIATYIIPDGTKIVITYDAMVTGNGPQKIVNKVKVNDKEDTIENTKDYGSASEGEGAVASFKIVKVDGYDASKKLSGVRFKIFAENEGINFGPNADYAKEIELITDNNGEIILDGGKYDFYFNETYHIQEIETPEDYGSIGFDYLVTLTNDMAQVDYGHYIYYYSDSMQIKNWPLEGLVIEKQVESDVEEDLEQYYKFRVSILNEDGSVNTDYNEKNGDDDFVNGVVEFDLKSGEQKMFWGFVQGTKYKVEEIDAKGLATEIGYDLFDEDGNVTEHKTETGTSHTAELTQKDEVIVFTNKREEKGSLKLKKIVTVNSNPTQGTLADGTYEFTVTGPADAEEAAQVSKAVTITINGGVAASATVDGKTVALDNDGYVEVGDLDPGVYTINEDVTKNPEGVRLVGNNGKTVTVAAGITGAEVPAEGKTDFTNDLETVTKTGTKQWLGDEERPTIWLKLFKVVTVTEGDQEETQYVPVANAPIREISNNSGSAPIEARPWTDLPKYDSNGDEIEYAVMEVNADGTPWSPVGYAKHEEGMIVTNKPTDEYNPVTNYIATKNWDDDNNSLNIRPADLVVKLYADHSLDGTAARTEVTSETFPDSLLEVDKTNPNQWIYTFSNLPVFDALGNAIKYEAEEVLPEGYQQTTALIQTEYKLNDPGEPSTIKPCNQQLLSLNNDKNLAYAIIKKGSDYITWTQRPATDSEKIILDKIGREAYKGSFNTPTYVSGFGMVSPGLTFKISGLDVYVEFDDPSRWSWIAFGQITASYTPGSATITNSPDVARGEVKVKKTLNGRDWTTADSFEFTITPANAKTPAFTPNKVTITSEDADSYTKSFGTLIFTSPGTYEWTVTETHKGETRKGVAYDAEDKTVTIVVEKNDDGKLVINPGSAAVQTAEFTNTYTVDETSIKLKATKNFTGREWKETDSFEFTLAADAGNPEGAALPETLKKTATKDEQTVTFDDIKFTKAGTYKFTITETKGDIPGVTYDTEPKVITVKVEDDGEGKLVATANPTTATVTASNTYTVDETSIKLKATKEFTGREWKDTDSFEFTLAADKENPEGATLPETVNKTATKDEQTVTFDDIKFTKAGEYTFTITEKKGDIPGVTYDTEPKVIKIGRAHV